MIVFWATTSYWLTMCRWPAMLRWVTMLSLVVVRPIHQFGKVGDHAFVGAGAIVLRDVPPYVMVNGQKNVPAGINSEGLKRRGFSSDAVMAIKRAYRAIYRANNTIDEAIEALQDSQAQYPEVAVMVEFLKSAERGIIR